MAITYCIDSAEGLVHSVFTGVVNLNDFDQYFQTLRNNRTFRPDYAGLCDWRQLENITVDYRNMYILATACPWGSGSSRAIVVSSPVVLGISRMYQSLSGDAHGRIQIFQDIDAARAWLASSLPATDPHPMDRPG